MDAPVNALVGGMDPMEIIDLLRRADALQPGAPLPGTRINPDVSSVYQREQYDAGTLYVATRHAIFTRTLYQIAASMGVPVEVQDTLYSRDILQTQAVLSGALLDLNYIEWPYQNRTQGTPVNETTIAAAVKLVTDAEKAAKDALERDVSQAEGKFR